MPTTPPAQPDRRNAGGMFALAALIAVAISLMTAGDVFARAGGGQGYHGSGSSNSGGFHSSSGGGGGGVDLGPLLYWGLQFCIHYPYIALPLIALAIYLFVKASQQGTDTYRTSVIRRAVGQTAELRRDAALQRLRAGDAAFDEAGFCGRAQQAFLKLQHAWSAQDLAPVRPFVSDGIFERFSLQIAEQRDFNYRNQVDQVTVAEVRLVQIAGDSIFDLLSVGIRAKADDYRVALDTGKRLGDGAENNEFVEYWTFLRRHGVTTGDRPGLVEGQCPNCGAQIELNESARCAACGSLVRSGNFDWVLVEITQSAEWNDDAPAEPPGVAEFRGQRDPGFNVEHLEDRASVIFWRKAMADRLGDTKPLLKMALPEFCDSYPQRWGPDKSLRRYWGDAAVGSVETLGVIAGEPNDRALVEVRWAGRTFTAQPGGRPEPAGENALFRTLYVLERRSGVTSDVAVSVTS
ncbi:MAG TPA: Tim44-like domain-containing protein, partial [Pirellulales bacterium]